MGEKGGEKRRSWEQRGHMRGRPGPTFRPPRSQPKQHVPSEAWQPSVPLWEKKFCTTVCSIPWEKICETQRVLPMYARVAKWDDSAGEEAFQNAKTRYWAEINGLPCDIPLPDPDAYIDVVDYDSVIDPLLVEDLQKLPPSVDSEEDLTCGWDSFLFADRPVPATGWGDEEDQVPTLNNKTEQYSTVPLNDASYGNAPFYSGWEMNDEGYGDFANRPNSFSDAVKLDYGNTQHGRAGKNNASMGGEDHSSGDGWNNSWGYSENWNNLPPRADGNFADRVNSFNDAANFDYGNTQHGRAGQNNISMGREDHSSANVWNNSWGHSENWNNLPPRADGKKRDRGGRFNSRHTNSRYHAGDNQGNNSWRASRGRGRINNAHKQSTPEGTDLLVWF